MELLRGALGVGGDQAWEVATAHAMLRRISAGESGPVLRVYRPEARVVAFGRRDSLLPGFPEAVAVARDAGFTPVLRAPGGRAVAYTENSLVVDHAGPDPGRLAGLEERFVGYAELWSDVLAAHGVAALVGAVPGEYCPGAHSVNARGRVKLVGTAQRMVRGAWLFSAVAILDDAAVLRPVLTEVYRALELPFDEDSVGSIAEEAPGRSLEGFEEALVAAYDARSGLTPSALPEELLTRAKGLVEDHRVTA
ncbi:lipoate--protein ligase family protein [Saccharopolyspora rhizosphaerae]|uniref:Lipoate--protein ligase family protein n=1 Tax=Saccharopolyspora rhizosphaerae TaxID=2492662 RepID=A0A426K4D6_9PSEU|nr:lipoate--protein ligase family protein [Saccharopolyspora rhizosphaerae]RRO20357.1 lipoate--protein ligase family protein [Saccharopolyspora rhizosphaerae]